jgi:hypothetical protein
VKCRWRKLGSNKGKDDGYGWQKGEVTKKAPHTMSSELTLLSAKGPLLRMSVDDPDHEMLCLNIHTLPLMVPAGTVYDLTRQTVRGKITIEITVEDADG